MYFYLMKKQQLYTIGRIERVDIPDWNIYGIEAKIDTGAYTSSVHCHHIEEVDRNGLTNVRFRLLDPEHEAYNEQLFEFPIHDRRIVKSSNGLGNTRIFIKTNIFFFGNQYEIELSLTDRSEMKFPILLGRKFLKNRFIVDVSKKHLSIKNSVN